MFGNVPSYSASRDSFIELVEGLQKEPMVLPRSNIVLLQSIKCNSKINVFLLIIGP